MNQFKFELGTKSVVQKRITREDTALNFGSGALKNLLATPTLAALMIEAAVKAIDPRLPNGYITIGRSIDILHENPSVQGMTVTVSAELIEQHDSKLVFDLKAYDELGEIGKGRHERYVVNHDVLMNKVDERCR